MSAPIQLTEEERTELLDWVSTCQSAYHIDNTPDHRFHGIGGRLEENRDALVEYVNELLASRAAPVETKEQIRNAALEGWIDAVQAPEVKCGGLKKFIVACHRNHNGKTYCFEAYYLNEHLLETEDDDCPEDGKPFTGWHILVQHHEYDDFYQQIETGGDKVTHYREFPDAPAIRSLQSERKG